MANNQTKEKAMAQTRHTPGPFHDGTDEFVKTAKDSPEYEREYWVVGPNQEHIATVYTKANAELLTATPELLAALKALLPWVAKAQADGAFVNCVAPDGGTAAIDQAEEVIAKTESK